MPRFLFILLFGLTACSPPEGMDEVQALLLSERYNQARELMGAGPRVRGADKERGRDPYYTARLAYQAGDFPAALQLAHRGLRRLLAEPTPSNRLANLGCLHLLAELHFDRAASVDSIGYYQRWAAAYLRPDDPPVLQAEQQLCRALAQLYDHEYTTQMSAARLGRELLTDHPNLHELHGRLLVAEGLGQKKNADLLAGQNRLDGLEEAAGLMTRAANQFRRAGSVRWREAQREKAIIVSRFDDPARFARAIMPLLPTPAPSSLTSAPAAAPPEGNAPFGFPDRLRGYYHHRRAAADSAIYYYQRFLAQRPAFDFHLHDEALWTLSRYGLKTGDLPLAEQSIRDQLVLYGCVDSATAQRPVGELIDRADISEFCPYPLNDLALLALARHAETGQISHLHDADAFCRRLLDNWEAVFRRDERESSVNQLTEIVHRLISTANETAFRLHASEPGPAAANHLLQTLERTRAVQLLNARIATGKASAGASSYDTLRNLQSQINLLKEGETRPEGLSTNRRRELQALQQKHILLSEELRRRRLGDGTVATALPPLAELRERLAPGQAVLQYASGHDRLLAAYYDRDTVLFFVPSAALDPLIDSLRDILRADATRHKPADYIPPARVLFRHLLGPLASRIPAIEELLIVPAGPLRQLPFSALLSTDPDPAATWETLPYLLHQVDVAYAPSLRLEHLNAGLRPARYAVLPVGSWTNPDLAGTFHRADRDLASLAPAGSRFFQQNDCRSSIFRKRLSAYGVLNFNLHAAGDPYNPYRNYLYFAPTDSLNGTTIGQLTTPARLVVLTACETGLGTNVPGEGTFSIARGFQQIGVPDVVYSLYKIPAASSAEVSRRFFHHLYAGLAPTAALAAARREMATGGRGTGMAFPGFWAGLVKG